MHRVKRQAQFGQPFGELRGCARVVVIEMRTRREDLDCIEAVAGNIGELFAAQPVFVKEVCGDAEAVIRQPLILPSCRG